MLGPPSAEPAPDQESYDDQGSDLQVHVPGVVVPQEGEQAGGRQQYGQGSPLGCVLIHPKQVYKGGDNDNTSPDANHTGQNAGGDSNESTAEKDFHAFS